MCFVMPGGIPLNYFCMHFFYFVITFQMLEIFDIHAEKLSIIFVYVVQSKTIIQAAWLFITLDILLFLYWVSFYKFFPKLIDFSVPVFFSRQLHVLAYSIIHCYDSDWPFALLQIWRRNLDSILNKTLGSNEWCENKRK